MWTGATDALKAGMKNVAFLRTNIEIIERFFAPGEVSEIWLTFFKFYTINTVFFKYCSPSFFISIWLFWDIFFIWYPF
jgi:hypothetical protein